MIVQQIAGYESVTINRPFSREDAEREMSAFERWFRQTPAGSRCERVIVNEGTSREYKRWVIR